MRLASGQAGYAAARIRQRGDENGLHRRWYVSEAATQRATESSGSFSSSWNTSARLPSNRKSLGNILRKSSTRLVWQLYTVDPHSGQNLDVHRDPASPTRTNDLLVPSIVTELDGKRAWAPKTLPVRRWQARQ